MVLVFAAAVARPGAGGEKVAHQNGDLNGDDAVDISDAVYLLSSLFTGGPPPVPIAPCPAASGFPDTGQTKCYGIVGAQGWVEVPCQSAECPGQDGAYSTGCSSEDRFADNGDGTVTDNCTGLMWLKDTVDANGDGMPDPLSWCVALGYCQDLSFAGQHDWRLPNVLELQSIVDYGRDDPSIDPVFGAVSDYYWASDTYTVTPSLAWTVHFVHGHLLNFGKSSRYYVRAVRNAP